jgi:hypothetical protein
MQRHDQEIDLQRKPFLLSGDGSDRRFYRFHVSGGSSLVAVIPATRDKKDLEEAASYYEIGSHLFKKNIPVPRIYEFDPDSGINIIEDLGEVLLYDIIQNHTVLEADKTAHYRDALKILVSLQVEGVQGFESRFCFDTDKYDRQLMLEREAGYFRKAFCEDLAGLDVDGGRIAKEFHRIADIAAIQPSSYLLHRDFQSRNLMIHNESLKIIDFQGARFGPLQYDVASLLIDPYVGLSDLQQQKLFNYYVSVLAKHINLDPDSFSAGYYYIALLRNLQMLGAFAFLFQVKGKIFFRSFLKPAARMLCVHLEKPEGSTFTYLRILADKGLAWVERNIEE